MNLERALTVFDRHARQADTDDPLALVQYLDLKTYLVGDINTKVDRASMAHSLEVREPLMDHTLENWKLALDINLTGTFIVARAAARRMREHGGGNIVNLASINAINPGIGIGSYPASKAGVIRLTEQMSIEWAPYGIRVNCVAPGFIDGGMSKAIYANPEIRRIRGGAVPLKRLGTCEDVAEAILWLASDAASYITGQNIAIDGGVINSVIANLPRH